MDKLIIRLRPTVIVAAAGMLLAACGGGGSSNDDTAAADPDTSATVPDTAVPAPGGDSPATTPTTPGAPTAPTTPTTPTTPAPTAPTTPTTPVSAATGNCNVTNFTAEALAQINAFRAQARTCGSTTYPAAPALAWNEKLALAAFGHSTDMATNNYFSHTSQDGRTFDKRITAAGYSWSRVAENIAAGQTTMTSVMTSWQKSPGHCANLMGAQLTQVGLSCVKGTTGASYPTYWTMTLARPR